ncbi:DMT family transporter [Gloeocapsopsis crepidinum LEGE 06123]|uniref:DMT family transporter n=1 Tax=Gloeocapsopsis crepidinum LEGE 06123 TaxID=588587 RepID=A0ABR9UPT4_9CHRO|nr:DMT family transporter [Gloeocapsopsis crepidinum]MBE9190281.1 DMT family transporter [Gloeocapsopsis crepidinum LEGE 06123]
MRSHQTSGRWRLGLALSLLTVFLWGILPIALSVTLQALDVYTLTWFRFLISFGLLAIYLASRQQLPQLQKLRSAGLGLVVVATVFLGINYLLFVQGLTLTSPANAQVLIQLAPVLFGIGAIAFFKERFNRYQSIGLSTLVLGLVLFFNEQLQSLLTANSTYLIGSGILVLAAAAWAVYALAQKQLLRSLSSANVMLLIYGGCALLFTPVATPSTILTLSLLHWGTLLFCGLNTLIAYGAFAEALEHWEASRVSAVLALTPVVTLASVEIVSSLLPKWIASEQLTLLGLIGAILVVSGSMAIALGRSR